MNNNNVFAVKARLILERWAAGLEKKDKKTSRAGENFEELFYALFRAKIPFEIAHELLSKATDLHYPTTSTARSTFNIMKRPGQVFNEFFEDWKKSIADKAKQAFFAFYPIDDESAEPEEVAQFGNMSAIEYSKQRRYIESFPILDTDALKKHMEETNKAAKDLEDMEKQFNGGGSDDETK